MFFLRCAFWLSIVYSSMSWPGALPLRGPNEGHAAVAAVQTRTSPLVARAAASATAYCGRHAAACLSDAERLTSLFATLETVAVRQPPRPEVAGPRPQVHDAKLARAT